MLANAECQSLHLVLTHRIREQARSHIFDQCLQLLIAVAAVIHRKFEVLDPLHTRLQPPVGLAEQLRVPALELLDKLIDDVVDGTSDQLGKHSISALERYRDDCLLAVLEAVKTTKEKHGRTHRAGGRCSRPSRGGFWWCRWSMRP